MPIGAPPPPGTAAPTGAPAGAAVASMAPAPQFGALSKTASAIVGATGAAVFAFPTTPGDQVWTGSLTCSAAGNYAASVGNVSWGTFGGSAPYGPLQARGLQTLVITATGLTPGALVTLTWLGSVGGSATPPIAPTPLPSEMTINNTTDMPVTVQVLELPPPPSVMVLSTNVVMTGSVLTGSNVPLKVGVACLADSSNTGELYVSNNATTGSGYLKAGQGVVIPIANFNGVEMLGTSGDVLSVWGA